MEREADCVIVGAGLSGLYLADKLVHESGIESVLVLEANHRIGGRILNQPTGNDGLFVEGGAQFVGGTHERMLALLDRLELEKFAAHVEGTFRWAQEIAWFRLGLSPDPTEPAAFEAVREAAEALAATVPIDAPWTTPDAMELDAITFGQWLRENSPSKAARLPYERLCTMHVGCDPNQVSLLYMLFLLQSTGGYHRFIERDGGAHQWRIAGGAALVCSRLANLIGEERILLDSAVCEVRQDDEHVYVSGDGFRVKADRVVVTLQPQLCKAIAFEPALSPDRIALQDGFLTVRPFAAKVHLKYARPFWRDKGYSGTGVTSSGVVFLDNTPAGEEVGILLAFRDTRRRDLTIDKLLKYAKTLFGADAANPDEIVEQDWSAEPWTASCISHTPPGILSRFGQTLREPVGRVHWAGAETSATWCSFMEGAVASAARVADEIAE